MIEVTNVTKKFSDFTALDNVTCTIPSGCVYGMVGSNGAGKSTFLRLISGVYKGEHGTIKIDGEDVYENPAVKSRIAFVSDDLFFLQGASIFRMRDLYRAIYPNFDDERFNYLLQSFGLNPKKPIQHFSKGMRRQAAILLALSCRPDYLFFDETFDGLDPVMRGLVKGLIYNDVAERGATAIITSHSLRELEDVCDQLALLHLGGLVLQSDVQNLKTSLFKVQIAFSAPPAPDAFDGINVAQCKQLGSVFSLIIRGNRDEIVNRLQAMNPVLLDVLPLTLEEVFTFEMANLGYSFLEVLEKEAQ